MFLQIFNLGPKYLFFAEFFYPFFALKQEITKIKHLMGRCIILQKKIRYNVSTIYKSIEKSLHAFVYYSKQKYIRFINSVITITLDAQTTAIER